MMKNAAIVILALVAMVFSFGCTQIGGGPDGEATTCIDGIQNQGENGIDCGGPCPACKAEETPVVRPQATCSDGIRNQGETDVDCGGPCSSCNTVETKPEPVTEIIRYELTSEQERSLSELIKLSDKMKFLTNSYPKGISVAQSHVFALGITNVMQDRQKFRVRFAFDYAQNPKFNALPAEKAIMETWVENNKYLDIELNQYEQKFIPVGITAGKQIASDKSAEPGNYYFKIFVDRWNGYKWESYSEDAFSIRVI